MVGRLGSKAAVDESKEREIFVVGFADAKREVVQSEEDEE